MLTRDVAGVQEGWDKPEQEHGDDLRADAERTRTWGSDRIGFIQSEIDRINEPLKKKRQKVDFVTKKGGVNFVPSVAQPFWSLAKTVLTNWLQSFRNNFSSGHLHTIASLIIIIIIIVSHGNS